MGWIALWLAVALAGDREASYITLPAKERSITEIRQDLRQTMRVEAQFDRVQPGADEHVRSIVRLLSLHCEMVRHSSFAEGFALRQSRSLLQSRLTRIAARINKRANEQPPQTVGSTVIVSVFERIPILAQQIQGGNGGQFAGAGGAGGAQAPAGGLGQIPDYGPDLVDLIQRVVNPDSWDVTGGPGTIVYYAPLHAIVVRGTAETHENVAQLLFDLRAAGGP